MANKPNSVSPEGKSLYIDGTNQAKRVDSFSTSNEFNEEKILELANSGVAEKVNNLVVGANVTFNNYGSIAPFMQCVGQGYWQNEDNPNRTFTDKDIENAIVDIIAKGSNDETNVLFSEWVGYMFLTSISWEFPADGFSTESYDFEGEHNRLFLNDWKQASLYKGDFSDSSTALVSGTNLQSVEEPILLEVNQRVVASLNESGHSITLTDNGADTDITATGYDGAVSFQSGDRIRLITSGSGSSFAQLPSTPAGIGALRRGHIVPKIYNPAGNAENTLRVQNISVDIDLGREELIELGSKDAYFREIKRPLNISISVDINETDLEEYAKLIGSETAFDANTLREINPSDFLKDNVLEILTYKDEISHTFANELVRYKFDNLSVSANENSSSTADITGTRSITFSAETFIISGSGTSPFLS